MRARPLTSGQRGGQLEGKFHSLGVSPVPGGENESRAGGSRPLTAASGEQVTEGPGGGPGEGAAVVREAKLPEPRQGPGESAAEGTNGFGNPRGQACSLGHIPAATSLFPSVSPPPTSFSHFHTSHSTDTSEAGQSPLPSPFNFSSLETLWGLLTLLPQLDMPPAEAQVPAPKDSDRCLEWHLQHLGVLGLGGC